MPVWGNRGVTEGTPRSPFRFLYTAMMSGYRAVAKRRGAYAAMPAWGYRAVAKRRSAYAAMYVRLRALCEVRVKPFFFSKNVPI